MGRCYDRRKTLIGGLALALALAALCGCAGAPLTGQVGPGPVDQGDPLAAVKNGTLSLDLGLTVGQAFDHYAHFKGERRWSFFKTPNQRSVVECSAALDLDKADMPPATIKRLTDVRFVAQFGINLDRSLEVRYLGWLVEPLDKPAREWAIPKGHYDLYLKKIYANEKFWHTGYELLIEGLM